MSLEKKKDKTKIVVNTKYGPPEVTQLKEVDKPIPKILKY